MLKVIRDHLAQARAASGANILLGIWLIASPWVFGFSGRTAVVSTVTVGAVVSLFAAFRLAALRESAGLSGVNFALGLWVIASPWACKYADHWGATVNNVVLGGLIASLAVSSGIATLAEERRLACNSG